MPATFYKGNESIVLGDSPDVKPVEGEVQVKIAYCGVCGTDLHIFHGIMDQRVPANHIMGHECSGEIAAVGDGVSGLEIGQKVVVRPLGPCGECAACKAGNSHICYNLNFLGVDTPGAMQSLWTVPADTIHTIPDNLSLDYAALIEPLAVACHDVKRGRVAEGEKVVVIGGGPIGVLAALVAKEAGGDVVVSEINPNRIAFAESLGIKAVNPLENPIEDYVKTWTEGALADVVIEASASRPGAAVMTKLARARGRIVVVGIFGQPPEVELKDFFLKEIEMVGARVYQKDDYDKAIELAASGKLPLKELITKVSPLSELEDVMRELSDPGNSAMKILIDCK